MECLFTEDEMLSCSVTGINTSKQPLDGHKTNALIGIYHYLISLNIIGRTNSKAVFKIRIHHYWFSTCYRAPSKAAYGKQVTR